MLFARNHTRPLGEVLAAFRTYDSELVQELEVMPATRLDEASPYGDTLLEFIAGNTYAHYDECTKLLAAAFGLRSP